MVECAALWIVKWKPYGFHIPKGIPPHTYILNHLQCTYTHSGCIHNVGTRRIHRHIALQLLCYEDHEQGKRAWGTSHPKKEHYCYQGELLWAQDEGENMKKLSEMKRKRWKNAICSVSLPINIEYILLVLPFNFVHNLCSLPTFLLTARPLRNSFLDG